MARLVHPTDGFNHRLKDFSMMARGGARLASLHRNDAAISRATLDAVNERLDEICGRLYRVAINEAPPASHALMQ